MISLHLIERSTLVQVYLSSSSSKFPPSRVSLFVVHIYFSSLTVVLVYLSSSSYRVSFFVVQTIFLPFCFRASFFSLYLIYLQDVFYIEREDSKKAEHQPYLVSFPPLIFSSTPLVYFSFFSGKVM